MLSKRKCDSVFIQRFESIQESCDARPVIFFVCAQTAGEAFFTVEGDPCELPAVIIQESRRKTDSASGSHIGKRCIMVCAVEVIQPPGAGQPVLNSL